MKQFKFLAIFLFLVHLYPKAQTSRKEISFNAQWKFHVGDVVNGQDPGFDDKNWTILDVPHDWSIESAFGEQWASATGYLPGGIGWYRKSFDLPATWNGKNVYVLFDGVYNFSEVWINGHHLGKRPNGFVPFYYELTKHLLKGKKNIIAVKADHSKFADARWYPGSGIYRDVKIIVVNPLHIDQWGVSFTTPAISKTNAKAVVQTNVVNDQSTPANIVVKALLKNAAGKIVASGEESSKLQASSSAKVTIGFSIKNPSLWSVENPNLYTLDVQLLFNGKMIDVTTEQVGIRQFRFDANTGFWLNERNMKLKGVCIHDDAGVLGVAVTEEVWIRRLDKLKALGCNSIRMAHNPHADFLYMLCDKMGFLVIDEAFDEWEYGKNKWIKGWNKGEPGKDGSHEYFNEWAEKDIEAMILRNRNRPSIFMWSIGNEIDYPNDPYSHEVLNTGRNPQIYGKGYLPDHPPASRLSELSARLAKAVKQFDTTRPVTAALAGVVMSNTTDYPKNIDVVGYNYQEYRYAEDHATYPERIIHGSENGMALGAWNAVDSNQYISAQYLWTGIDYMGEAGSWPTRSNGAGLLNLGGFEKPQYYFRQSLWSNKPMIKLATGRSGGGPRRMEPDWNKKYGDSVNVICFTNCEEAELFLNGKSISRKTLSSSPNKTLVWPMIFETGLLTVKGFRNGKVVSNDTLQTTGEAALIKASVYQHPMIKKQKGVEQIEVTITDKEGKVLYSPGNTIRVEVKGKAVFKGIENSSLNDTSFYKANNKKALNGPLVVYLQPPADGSTYEVLISSEGLQPATVRFPAKK